MPTLLGDVDFSMWTMSQVKSFFHDKAHPDWRTWDRLDHFLGVSSIDLDGEDIKGRLVEANFDVAVPLESIGPLLERFHNWQIEEKCKKTDLVKAEIVKAYWRKEELWRLYQNCNFRLRVLTEYRHAVRQYRPLLVLVSLIILQLNFSLLHVLP